MAIFAVTANCFQEKRLSDSTRSDRYGTVVIKLECLSLNCGGARFTSFGCSDARSEGKLRGCTLQGALVDEASLIPKVHDRTSTAYRHEQWPHLRDNDPDSSNALA